MWKIIFWILIKLIRYFLFLFLDCTFWMWASLNKLCHLFRPPWIFRCDHFRKRRLYRWFEVPNNSLQNLYLYPRFCFHFRKLLIINPSFLKYYVKVLLKYYLYYDCEYYITRDYKISDSNLLKLLTILSSCVYSFYVIILDKYLFFKWLFLYNVRFDWKMWNLLKKNLIWSKVQEALEIQLQVGCQIDQDDGQYVTMWFWKPMFLYLWVKKNTCLTSQYDNT